MRLQAVLTDSVFLFLQIWTARQLEESSQMAVAISPEDLTIEHRVESDSCQDSPRPSTPKSSRRSRRLKPGQKPTARAKQIHGTPSKKSPIGESTGRPPNPKPSDSEVVDLGLLAMDIGKAIGDSISASMCSSISQFTQDMIVALKDSPRCGWAGSTVSSR